MPYHEWVIAFFSILGASSTTHEGQRNWFAFAAWLNVGAFYIMAYYNLLSIDTLHEYAHWNWLFLAAAYFVPYAFNKAVQKWGRHDRRII